jgi:hypothetical protein
MPLQLLAAEQLGSQRRLMPVYRKVLHVFLRSSFATKSQFHFRNRNPLMLFFPLLRRPPRV